MKVTHQPSCDDPFDSLLPVQDARAKLSAALNPVGETETVPLHKACARVLAVDIESPIAVPSHTNSAMDGYAIASSDIPVDGVAKLSVTGTSWAGQPYTGQVEAGHAVRIFTGGMIPAGTDTVVIQEHVLAEGDVVTIDSRVEAGRNVRHAGEDVQPGKIVLHAGAWLQAAEVGMLASLGIAQVEVTRRIRVAFFTTGDELRSLESQAGQPLDAGALYDSNRYSLIAMLQRLDVDTIDLGIVRDNADDTRRAFEQAAASADVIVTSGGVSAGDADFVTRVFHELGDVAFWKLAMRPGRPLAFGQLGDAFFFGLPGNPVAVMVTFLQFVQPAIKQLMGMRHYEPLTLNATCTSALRKSPGRTEYQRGILSHDENGQLCVCSTGKQGAGRISSMLSANCLIVIDPAVDKVEPGDTVQVQPFYGLFD